MGAANAAAQKPWASVVRRNCFSSAADGYMGADVVSERTNPIVSHMSLESCQAACMVEEECEAVVMEDINITQPTCWLRKRVQVENCSNVWNNFTLWLKPGGRTYDTANPPDTLVFSVSGTSCSEDDWTLIRRVHGLTLPQCEDRCREDAACNAVQYEHLPLSSPGRGGPTCALGRLETGYKCQDAPGFELRIVKTIGLGLLARAPGWPMVPAKMCYPGQGGEAIGEGSDPMPRHLLLHECQDACAAREACEGFVWADTQDGASANCRLRRSIDLGSCQNATFSNVWLKPAHAAGVLGPEGPKWLSHTAANCFPHLGEALAGRDGLDGHLALVACQRSCLQTAGCSAVIWHDSKDAHSLNCWLRGSGDLDSCMENPEFNLMVLANSTSTEMKAHPPQPPPQLQQLPQPQPPQPPPEKPSAWESIVAKNCRPGEGADFAINGIDVLPAHLALQDCQDFCDRLPACDAIVWKDTKGGREPNCFPRKQVDISRCATEPGSLLRLKPSTMKKFLVDAARAPAWPAAAAAHRAGAAAAVLAASAALAVGCLALAKYRMASQDVPRAIWSRGNEDEREALVTDVETPRRRVVTL